MLQRRVLQFAAVVLMTGLLVPSGQAGGDKDKGKEGGHHHAMFQKCAKACNDCQRMCDACSHHCAHLIAEGKKEHMKTLHSCQDCAAICAVSAQISARGGPYAGLICKTCAEACKRCGEACDKVSDDKMMKECADECRRCEKTCMEMVEHIGQMKGEKTEKGDVKDKSDK
jgi:hypothetical protein